jgi:hypothetical protein
MQDSDQQRVIQLISDFDSITLLHAACCRFLTFTHRSDRPALYKHRGACSPALPVPSGPEQLRTDLAVLVGGRVDAVDAARQQPCEVGLEHAAPSPCGWTAHSPSNVSTSPQDN